MAYSVRFLSKAEQDIAEAIEWYNTISKKVAQGFLFELNRSFEAIRQFPEAYPIVYVDLRMFVLNTFPYKVIYLVTDSEIIVQAVTHHKQHPNAWQLSR